MEERKELTDRQMQMLAMAAMGMSNQAIADELGVALSTVANTLTATYRKVGARNRVLAVQWLIKRCGEV